MAQHSSRDVTLEELSDVLASLELFGVGSLYEAMNSNNENEVTHKIISMDDYSFSENSSEDRV